MRTIWKSLPRSVGVGAVLMLGLAPEASRAEPAKAPLAASATPSKAGAPDAEPPAALEHVRAATALAKKDLTAPLFLCRADSWAVVRENLEKGSKKWLEPARIFDDLYFIGNEFVGVFVLRTSAGLILFDSLNSAEEVEQKLVPGLVKLGLNPKDIKYVVVTHGHYDHFGGAAQLQKAYGARIALGGKDWDLIEQLPPDALERNSKPIPKRDIAVTDGQKLTLGDTTVTLHLTPGHTPATVSALIPVKDGGATRVLSLFGSTAFPPSLEPTPKWGGLKKYDESVLRFQELGKKAGAVGILNTHAFSDGGLARLSALGARKPGAPHPFVLGAEATARHYSVLHECLQAAQIRPIKAPDWSKPATPAGGPASKPAPASLPAGAAASKK